MNQPPEYRESFDSLEKVAPDAAEYMQLVLEMIHDYEDTYRARPQDVLQCFPGALQEDRNEIMALLCSAIERNGTVKSDLQIALRELASQLSHSPVASYVFRPIFEYFSVVSHSTSSDLSLDSDKSSVPMRIVVPNLLYAPHEMATFFKACGFVVVGQTGSHQKWGTPEGAFVKTLPLTSKKLWLKNIIAQLLNNRVPLETIVSACRSLKIDFRLL